MTGSQASRYDPDEDLLKPAREAASLRQECAWPGCSERGLYRAPKSRESLRDFVWLCLAHVREYNRTWDFFKGMSAFEIDAHRRADVTWHRPTWRLGSWYANGGAKWRDPFDVFGEEVDRGAPTPSSEAARMMRVLGLRLGFTLQELRSRYRELVKASHPDLHGGDKAREEALRITIEAYRYLLAKRLYADA